KPDSRKPADVGTPRYGRLADFEPRAEGGCWRGPRLPGLGWGPVLIRWAVRFAAQRTGGARIGRDRRFTSDDFRRHRLIVRRCVSWLGGRTPVGEGSVASRQVPIVGDRL